MRTADDTALFTGEIEARWAVDVATLAVAELAARLRVAHPLLSVTTTVVRGEPGDVLAELASPDALIVVGSEKGGTADYEYSSLLGTRLAAAARGAVAIIPVGDDEVRHGAVVGVGESDEALSPALFAAELASRRNEPLHVVRACAHHAAPSAAADDADQHALRVFLSPVTQAHPELTIETRVEHGSAVSALLARAQGAALVVVGARRPGVVRRLFLGSVSQALVNNVQCPLLIVAAPQGPSA